MRLLTTTLTVRTALIYPLNRRLVTILLGVSVCLLPPGCSSQGPLTPEEAFRAVARAHRNSDAQALLSLLSAGSLTKIGKITRELSHMENGQASALAGHLGVPMEKLKELRPADFVMLQLNLGKRLNEDVVREASSLKIIGTDIKDKRASVRVENGMELFFVKEGPYWKFELE